MTRNSAAIGERGVSVSPLGFGGAAIGNLYAPVSEADARSAIEEALVGGIRYFDTAPFYGHGLSEERIGRALAGRQRAAFTVSTKVGRLISRDDSRLAAYVIPTDEELLIARDTARCILGEPNPQ